jgi:hypothetical protein
LIAALKASMTAATQSHFLNILGELPDYSSCWAAIVAETIRLRKPASGSGIRSFHIAK